MNDTRLHSALREWRRHVTHPVALTSLAGVAAVLTLVGPFGTEALLRFGPRLLYWLIIVSATYMIGFLAGELLWPRLRRVPRIAGVGIVGVAAGIEAMLAIYVINLAAFGPWLDPDDIVPFAATVIGIAVIVTIVLQTAEAHLQGPVAPVRPALLDRLPPDKRGPLVALSVEDHYVRVRTTKGEEMLLMRLSDAIREVGTAGLQVHRSHWVATDQVKSAIRQGDRAVLQMRHGGDIPVSRRHISAIKEAGLLV